MILLLLLLPLSKLLESRGNGGGKGRAELAVCGRSQVDRNSDGDDTEGAKSEERKKGRSY